MRAAAQVAFGDVEARCPACVREPAMREEWGCDQPAEEPVFWITCTTCDGGDPHCETCGGTAKQSMYRCPANVLWPGAGRLVDAYQWSEKGLLPSEGGVADQPAILIRSLKEFGREVGRIKEAREARMKKLRKRGA